MSTSYDLIDWTLRALETERRWPEPRLVEPPPLVAHMCKLAQDSYIAEFAAEHPDSYRAVVFDAINPGALQAPVLCDALASSDYITAGALLAQIVRPDLLDAIDRRRGARP